MDESGAKGWRPAGEEERLAALDALRGLALLGVLLVNLHSDFRVSLPERLLSSPSTPATTGRTG
jgi:uncharacterized membrane protein YeiB